MGVTYGRTPQHLLFKLLLVASECVTKRKKWTDESVCSHDGGTRKMISSGIGVCAASADLKISPRRDCTD